MLRLGLAARAGARRGGMQQRCGAPAPRLACRHARPMTSLSPAAAAARGETLRAITRRLLLKCHPDYFVSAPKKYRRNTRSLQELQGLLDAAFPAASGEDEDERLVAPSALRAKVTFDLHGQRPRGRQVSSAVFDVPAECEPEALADIVQGGLLALAHQAGVELRGKEARLFATLAAAEQRGGGGSDTHALPGDFDSNYGPGYGAADPAQERRAEAEQMLRAHEYGSNTEAAERDELDEVVSQVRHTKPCLPFSCFSFLFRKTVVLPRQAQDEREQTSKQGSVFCFAQLFFAPELGSDPEAQQAALQHLATQLPQLRREELWRDLPLVVGVPGFSSPAQDRGGWLAQGFLAVPAFGWTAGEFLAYAAVAAPAARRLRAHAQRRRRDYGD